MEGLDIEVRGRPGPQMRTLEGVLGRLGHRVRPVDAVGPPAQLVLHDVRAGMPAEAELLGYVGLDRRPQLILADEPHKGLAGIASEHGHVMVAVDSAALEPALRVALHVCSVLGAPRAALA